MSATTTNDLPPPTYKPWIRWGLILLSFFFIAMAYILYEVIYGPGRPRVFNYVPDWSGVVVGFSQLIGSIILVVGLIKRRNYRVRNGLPMFKPAFSYVVLMLFLLGCVAAFDFLAMPSLEGMVSEGGDISMVHDWIRYAYGAFVAVLVLCVLKLAISGFKLTYVKDGAQPA